ncbi:MAG TPA: hypothetical protein VGA92_05645 [Candidatus Nitrosotenuis sp.]|jgi:hypothetical protein
MTTTVSQLSFTKRVQIGCVAGLVGGFAIFVSIFVIDLSLGASQGTFYKVVGLPAGIAGIYATLFGMVLHMLTAALMGTIFGIGSGIHKLLEISSLKKGAVAGIVTSLVVFLVFFMPISTFLIIPLLQSSAIELGEASQLLVSMELIMIGSLELHVVFGMVMGIFFAVAVQHESKKLVEATAV